MTPAPAYTSSTCRAATAQPLIRQAYRTDTELLTLLRGDFWPAHPRHASPTRRYSSGHLTPSWATYHEPSQIPTPCPTPFAPGPPYTVRRYPGLHPATELSWPPSPTTPRRPDNSRDLEPRWPPSTNRGAGLVAPPKWSPTWLSLKTSALQRSPPRVTLPQGSRTTPAKALHWSGAGRLGNSPAGPGGPDWSVNHPPCWAI